MTERLRLRGREGIRMQPGTELVEQVVRQNQDVILVRDLVPQHHGDQLGLRRPHLPLARELNASLTINAMLVLPCDIQREALRNFPNKKIMLYCWRGGMRSQILSWLLTQVGFEVYRLAGGYKTYRTFTFNEVRESYPLLVLGGKTGAAKTVLLQKLKERGEQVVDLEGLANHKGSSFGAIGLPAQPTVEQFENLLAEQLRKIQPDQAIWVENESRRIGRIILPDPFYLQMTQSPRIEIEKTDTERIAHITSEYAALDQAELSAAVLRLQKRLGGDRTKQAVEAIQTNQPEIWIPILLQYYDKTYSYDLERHEVSKTIHLNLEGLALEDQVNLLLQTKP